MLHVAIIAKLRASVDLIVRRRNTSFGVHVIVYVQTWYMMNAPQTIMLVNTSVVCCISEVRDRDGTQCLCDSLPV